MPKFKIGDKIRRTDSYGNYRRKDDTTYKVGEIAIIKDIRQANSGDYLAYQFEDDAYNSPEWVHVEDSFDLAHIDNWKELVKNA